MMLAEIIQATGWFDGNLYLVIVYQSNRCHSQSSLGHESGKCSTAATVPHYLPNITVRSGGTFLYCARGHQADWRYFCSFEVSRVALLFDGIVSDVISSTLVSFNRA